MLTATNDGARTSGVTYRHRGRPATEPEGVNVAATVDSDTFILCKARFYARLRTSLVSDRAARRRGIAIIGAKFQRR